MLGLTPLGLVHTAISLVALVAGFAALWQYRAISFRTRLGQVFVAGTVLSCLTGFGIFQHGGFGNPHILAIVTLLVISAALVAGHTQAFGRALRHVETVGYSFALFLHFIPGTIETLTRLPPGAPYLVNADDPKAQPILGAFFLLFLVGSVWQVLHLRAVKSGLSP